MDCFRRAVTLYRSAGAGRNLAHELSNLAIALELRRRARAPGAGALSHRAA